MESKAGFFPWLICFFVERGELDNKATRIQHNSLLLASPVFLHQKSWKVQKWLDGIHTVGGWNPANQLIVYPKGFIHPRWCRISSINSMKRALSACTLVCVCVHCLFLPYPFVALQTSQSPCAPGRQWRRSTDFLTCWAHVLHAQPPNRSLLVRYSSGFGGPPIDIHRNWVVTPTCNPKPIFGDLANFWHKDITQIMPSLWLGLRLGVRRLFPWDIIWNLTNLCLLAGLRSKGKFGYPWEGTLAVVPKTWNTILPYTSII